MKILYFSLFSLLVINEALGFAPKPVGYLEQPSNFGVTRGIDDQLRKLIESLRSQMKDGFPEYGIPPLAPFKRSYEEIDFEHEFLTLFATVTNLTINGADNFELRECDFKFWGLKLKLNFNFNSLHIKEGLYELELLTAEELGIVVQGNGSLDYEVKNLSIDTELQIGIGWKGLKIKSFKTVIDVESCRSNITGLISDGLTTEIINRVFEQLTLNIVKDHKNDISKIIHDVVVPFANNLLSKITIKDIFKWIFGKK